MTAVLAVAAREIRERRMVFVVGLAGAFLAALGAYYVEPPVGVIIALNVSMAVAAAAGASVVGRDLGERRLGFYFARPLSGAAIWGGKILAAFVLGYGTLAIVLMAVVPFLRPSPEPTPAAAVLLPAAVIACAAGLAGFLRARTSEAVLDVAGFVAVLVAGAALALGLERLGFPGREITGFLAAEGALLILLLLAASAVQVVVGRNDLRRGRRAMSSLVWGGLLAFTAVGALTSCWIVGMSPADLDLKHAGINPSPTGPGILIGGGGRASFMLDTSTGRHARLGRQGQAVWSSDGNTVASLTTTTDTRGPLRWLASPLLVRTRFTASEPEVVELKLEGSRIGHARALSPDGRRLLAEGPDWISIIDTEDGRTLARFDGARRGAYGPAFFLPNGTVRRIYRIRDDGSLVPGTVIVEDWDPATGAHAERGRIAGVGSMRVRADGERLLLSGEHGMALYGIDGSLLARVVERNRAERNREPSGGFLSDDRIAVVHPAGRDTRVRTFGPNGEPGLDVVLPGRVARVGGEPLAGVIAIGVDDGTLLVDLASGAIRRREPDLTPALWRAERLRPGAPATRLFWAGKDDGRQLVDLDPMTGQRRVVLGAED